MKNPDDKVHLYDPDSGNQVSLCGLLRAQSPSRVAVLHAESIKGVPLCNNCERVMIANKEKSDSEKRSDGVD